MRTLYFYNKEKKRCASVNVYADGLTMVYLENGRELLFDCFSEAENALDDAGYRPE